MGRAWWETCELEAARLASRFHEKGYRGMVVSVFEMEMKPCRRRGSNGIIRQQCQLRQRISRPGSDAADNASAKCFPVCQR